MVVKERGGISRQGKGCLEHSGAVKNSSGMGGWEKPAMRNQNAANVCFLTFTPWVFHLGAKPFDIKTINTILPNGQEPCDRERITFHFILLGLLSYLGSFEHPPRMQETHIISF